MPDSMRKNFNDSSFPSTHSRLAFLRRSLFLKLVLVYTGTMVVLMLTIGAGFAVFLRETTVAARAVRVRSELLQHTVDEGS